MWSNEIENIRHITEFMKLVEASGFGSSYTRFSNFISQFKNDQGKCMRFLYLHAISLADVSLKPGIVNMVGGEYADQKDLHTFEKEIWSGYEVFYEDRNMCSASLDLRDLRLSSPFKTGESKIILAQALATQPSKKLSKHKQGSIWELQWLMEHQEFIPESWWRIMRRHHGCIIFPEVRLWNNRSKEKAKFPLLWMRDGSRLDISCYNLEDITLRRNKDFIAYVPKV